MKILNLICSFVTLWGRKGKTHAQMKHTKLSGVVKLSLSLVRSQDNYEENAQKYILSFFFILFSTNGRASETRFPTAEFIIDTGCTLFTINTTLQLVADMSK